MGAVDEDGPPRWEEYTSKDTTVVAQTSYDVEIDGPFTEHELLNAIKGGDGTIEGKNPTTKTH